MTYPPGNPGYPPPPQPNQYSAPNQAPNPQYGRAPERIPVAAPSAPDAPSSLPLYLTLAVVVLGLFVFGFAFADPYGIKPGELHGEKPEFSLPRDIMTFLPAIAAVAASLLAGVGLLPKQKEFKAWVAILSILGLLLAIVDVGSIQVPGLPPTQADKIEIQWGLYCVLAFAVLQAGCALAALLLDAGVIKPPAPKPQVDPYGYGAPGQYYGQAAGQHAPQQHAPQHAQARPDYGQQYGQQGGYPQPAGYGTRPQQSPADESPVTPATGFPSYGQSAPGAGSASSEAGSGYPGGAAPSAAPASEATQTFQQQQAPQQSDPTSS